MAHSSPLGSLTFFNLNKKIRIKKVNLALKNVKSNRALGISVIRFSLNSNYLFCCAKIGKLYFFRVDGHLKLISKQYLHESPIMDIIQRIITSP